MPHGALIPHRSIFGGFGLEGIPDRLEAVKSTKRIKVGLQQRVLPTYRIPFIESLAAACPGELCVFAGQPQRGEMIVQGDRLQHARLVTTTNYHLSNPASGFYLCWQKGILGWIQDWQPDVLIVEANSRYLSTRQAIRWMHRQNRPVMGWGLGAPPLMGIFRSLRQQMRSPFFRSLDGLIAYSQTGAQQYESLGFNSQKIFVASNAIVPKPANPPQERPDFFIEKPNVLFIGRLQERKRIDNLLYACARLPEALQPQLVVIGDGPARPTWEALAQKVYPMAEFKGAKHGMELEPYFERADLFVLPGTGGLAVQQAMAHGLPVIVAQGDGTQDDLVWPASTQQEGNGWIVPPNDLLALTETLQIALSDVAGLRRKGMESYRIVVQEANIEHMVDVFITALNSVTGQL
jgi:glycosyltransferase involved in cell wall biosynthesis